MSNFGDNSIQSLVIIKKRFKWEKKTFEIFYIYLYEQYTIKTC